MRIFLRIGNIVDEDSDAIVNAANAQLAGGGGVDGAIHRAGGPQIMEECRAIGGCPPGEAVITSGGNLRARFVIHTVGPIWRGGGAGEPEILASCYRESVRLAIRHDLKSISFSSISTGVYGYPVDLAAAIAIRTVTEENPALEVGWVLFDQRTYDAYATAFRQLSR